MAVGTILKHPLINCFAAGWEIPQKSVQLHISAHLMLQFKINIFNTYGP